MAVVTWVGGAHKITDPNVWTPTAIAPGDVGEVPAGHVIAVDQALGTVAQYGSYAVNLEGTPSTSTFDALNATNNGQIGSFDPDDPNFGGGTQVGSGTADFVGANTSNGGIEASGNLSRNDGTPSLSVAISDVTSPAGVVIQQGILNNNGDIDVEQANVDITGTSSNAEIFNLGVISADSGDLTIDVPIEGGGSLALHNYVGLIFVSANSAPCVVTFSKPVAADQQINFFGGTIHLTDPLGFQGLFANYSANPGEFIDIDLDQTVASASYIDQGLTAFGVPYSTLTLMNGSTVVAELRFLVSFPASDLVVYTGPSGTVVSSPGSSNAPVSSHIVPIATTGTVPALPTVPPPPSVIELPSSGPNLTLSSGAPVASIEELNGYIVKLDGATAAAAPSLNESSVVFGANFTLEATGFGGLAAVGYNANDGTVEALGGATLAVGVTDVTSLTDGVTILAGAFNNLGTIEAASGGAIDITGSADSKLINAGNVVADGMVFLGPTITGTGTMTVGSSGSLELGGYVATGQAIDLLAGALTIDAAREFFATIFDFGPSGTIVLKGADVSGVTYDNGALLLDGGTDGTLHLHRPDGAVFTTQSFQLAHAGGNTSITISA